jgi:CheY-like chemotaxis protein
LKILNILIQPRPRADIKRPTKSRFLLRGVNTQHLYKNKLYFFISLHKVKESPFVKQQFMQKEKANILVSDDEPHIRNLLRSFLEAEGHQVTEARDGVECFYSVTKNDYDVVFSDIKTPRMDGIEALERIVALGTPTQVIMCSGMANEETAKLCFEIGATGFLFKPVNLNMLSGTLSVALRVGRRIRMEKSEVKK